MNVFEDAAWFLSLVASVRCGNVQTTTYLLRTYVLTYECMYARTHSRYYVGPSIRTNVRMYSLYVRTYRFYIL